MNDKREKIKKIIDEFEMKLRRNLTKKEVDFLVSIVQGDTKRGIRIKR